ncbi:MAG: hypothetical protein JNL32_02120 [Candidatus Kapabacteria bacterium]|nr:hypothetical protein [Candidatus Kapabacteria bacterium]
MIPNQLFVRAVQSQHEELKNVCRDILTLIDSYELNRTEHPMYNGNKDGLLHTVESIKNLVSYIYFYCGFIEPNLASNLIQPLTSFRNGGLSQIAYSDDDQYSQLVKTYINEGFRNEVLTLLNVVQGLLPYSLLFPYPSAELSNMQALSSELITKQNGINELINNYNKTVADGETKIQEFINEKIATIQFEARSISITSADAQFGNAVRDYSRSSKIWGGLAAAIVIAICIIIPCMKIADAKVIGNVVDYTPFLTTLITKVGLLAVLGSIATIAIKIFRTQLHLLEASKHRQRLTNSIQDFINAARPDDQTQILMTLVNAVATPTDSGLTQQSDSVMPITQIIEATKKSSS